MHHNQHDHHNINPQSDMTPQTKFFNPLALALVIVVVTRIKIKVISDHHPGGVVGQKLIEQKG